MPMVRDTLAHLCRKPKPLRASSARSLLTNPFGIRDLRINIRRRRAVEAPRPEWNANQAPTATGKARHGTVGVLLGRKRAEPHPRNTNRQYKPVIVHAYPLAPTSFCIRSPIVRFVSAL